MKSKFQAKEMLLLCIMFISVIKLSAQSRTIIGTVTSEDGIVMAGVSVS